MRTRRSRESSILPVLDLLEAALAESDPDTWCREVLALLGGVVSAEARFLKVIDPRLVLEPFDHLGLSAAEAESIERETPHWMGRFTGHEPAGMIRADILGTPFVVLPLAADERVLGVVGFRGADPPLADEQGRRIHRALGRVLDGLGARASLARQLAHLQAAERISSLLARGGGLSDALEVVLFACMQAVSAEAASILLLDDERRRFRFVHTQGAARPQLGEITFDADEGIAGRVLRTLEAETVNEAADDPRFLRRLDEKTGFRTRNLVAVPLVADNPIGVLEVLNRSGGLPFSVEDRLLLVGVAEQISYAIRNASTFDRVMSEYCKRRQQQDSCEGCPHPVDDWEPCVRYRGHAA